MKIFPSRSWLYNSRGPTSLVMQKRLIRLGCSEADVRRRRRWVATSRSVNAAAGIMFSSALIYEGIPEHPEGHDMTVRSLRVYALQ
jgi:hypothetical protein